VGFYLENNGLYEIDTLCCGKTTDKKLRFFSPLANLIKWLSKIRKGKRNGWSMVIPYLHELQTKVK
jgi:hypothetical protein